MLSNFFLFIVLSLGLPVLAAEYTLNLKTAHPIAKHFLWIEYYTQSATLRCENPKTFDLMKVQLEYAESFFKELKTRLRRDPKKLFALEHPQKISMTFAALADQIELAHIYRNFSRWKASGIQSDLIFSKVLLHGIPLWDEPYQRLGARLMRAVGIPPVRILYVQYLYYHCQLTDQ